MKKIQSGEGASDFGTVEKQSPLEDWEKELLAQATKIVPDSSTISLVANNQHHQMPVGPVPAADPSLFQSVPLLPTPLDEKWVTDVIYANWQASHDTSGFPHWIANAARIIVAGR